MSSISSSSTSTKTVSAPANLYTLRARSEVNARVLDQTINNKIEQISGTLALGASELQQIRARKTLDEELIPDDCRFVTSDPHALTAVKLQPSEYSSDRKTKEFIKRGYLVAANRLYREVLSFWISLQDLRTRGMPLEAKSIAEVASNVDRLVNNVFKLVPIFKTLHAPRGGLCSVRTMRIDGMPPASFKVTIPLSLEGAKTDEEIRSDQKLLVTMYEAFKANTLFIVLFTADPTRQEFLINPTRLTNQKVQESKVSGIMHGNLEPWPDRLITSCESLEKRKAKFKLIAAEEQKMIEDAFLKLKLAVELDEQIAALPRTAPVASTSSSAPSYADANAIQKQKRVKPIPTEVSKPDPITVIPAAPRVIERPKITISDRDAYATFQTLIGAEKNKVNWNEALHCLRTIGFAVTQNPGSNTWKFKWNTQVWLRDEKTVDELADEFEAEEPAPSTNATTSMHLPHQGGLTTRAPLDHGRLSSFRKLLDEACFDEDSVILKQG